MARINLLPWRDELKEKRKKEFIAVSIGVALLGVLGVVGTWMYFDNKLEDQNQANQLVITTNQSLDVQLKSLEGLQAQRDAIVERMKLIQGLQGQRPIAVRLVDELVRVTPSNMYITKFVRQGDKFTLEGRADSPNTVADLLRNLEASSWYRNAFMNSFLAVEENKEKPASSLVPRAEDNYGSFVVTVDLDEIKFDLPADAEIAASEASVETTGATQ
jgi:type IV pilus assembly protein PilN